MSARPGNRAILSDFNGVLLDDETFHCRAFREVLRPYGVPLGRARYNSRYLVFEDRTALAAMWRDAGLRDAPPDGLLRRKRQRPPLGPPAQFPATHQRSQG